MHGVKQIGGIALASLSLLVLGCGGSSTSPGTSGKISGTVTRVLVPGMPDQEPIRTPFSDTEVEVFQGETLKQKTQTDGQGRFMLTVPAGSYRVKPSDAILERTPAIIGSQDVTVSVGKTVPVTLEVTIPLP